MSEWVSAVDPGSGATYYLHTVTQESSWTVPEGFIEGGASYEYEYEYAAADVVADSDTAAGTAVWEERVDEGSGAVYYFNAATQEARWEQPAAESVEDPDAAASNWSLQTDPASGISYYLNTVTELSTWDMPTCMLVKEPAAAEEPPPGRPRGLSAAVQLPKIGNARAFLRSSFNLDMTDASALKRTAAGVEATPSFGISAVAGVDRTPPAAESKSARKSAFLSVDVDVVPEGEGDGVCDGAGALASGDAAAVAGIGSAASAASASGGAVPPRMLFPVKDDITTAALIDQAEGSSMEDYGTKYFNFDRKSLFGKKTTVEKLLGWKDEQIKTSLKSLSPELTALAIQLYRYVTGFIGDRSSGKPPIEHGIKVYDSEHQGSSIIVEYILIYK
jgi:hypothetical protein